MSKYSLEYVYPIVTVHMKIDNYNGIDAFTNNRWKLVLYVIVPQFYLYAIKTTPRTLRKTWT